MLNADGTSTAFGVTFRNHDNRKMQHILRAHSRLPENPNVRSTLYLALTNLENSLLDNEAQPIRDWLRDGGSLSEFPGPSTAQGPPIDGDARRAIEESSSYANDSGNNQFGRRGNWYGAPARSHSEQTQASGYQPHAVAGADETIEFERNRFENDDDSKIAEEHGREVQDTSGWGSDPTAYSSDQQQISPRRAAEDEDEAEVSTSDDGFEMASDEYNQEASITPAFREPVRDFDVNGHPYVSASDAQIVASVSDTEIPEGTKECCICLFHFAPEDFPESTKITSTCNHDHEQVACIGCIRQALRTRIDYGETRRIYCVLCSEFFQHEDIMKYGTPEIIARYEHLVLMANPSLIMCLGPNCGAGQVHPENHKENPVMVCNSCGFKTCTVHMLPWHEGFSCEEFDCDESQIERLEADEATAKLLSKNSKVCPDCKQGVTKTDGCDHLQCRCGQEWCFECLASWENIMRIGDTAHARHCSYHPDKVRLRADQRDASARNMAELVHGGPVSEALARARVEHNAKRREKLRPLALEAAEKRAKAMKDEADAKTKEKATSGDNAGAGGIPPRKKPKLIAPWEEK